MVDYCFLLKGCVPFTRPASILRRLFSDYWAITKGFLILFTIINHIKKPLKVVLKDSSRVFFYSVGDIIKHFQMILTGIWENAGCKASINVPSVKIPPFEWGYFTDGKFCSINERRVFLTNAPHILLGEYRVHKGNGFGDDICFCYFFLMSSP